MQMAALCGFHFPSVFFARTPYMSMRVLVTGASGFLGAALVRRLAQDPDFQVVSGVRQVAKVEDGGEMLVLGDLADACFEAQQFKGVSVVVHAAARVHILKDDSSDPLQAFRQVNVAGTLSLARAAAAAGVRRFVFVSSIKVNGDASRAGFPFRADDAPAPRDSYGISKLEAERALQDLAAKTGMELVIVRPPLVYGPGVGANFRSMMRWLWRGVPLPLGGTDNRRSLVALPNLVDLLVLCLTHPAAAGQVLLVSDGVDVSTSELLAELGGALGRPARLLPVSSGFMRRLFALLGREALWQRLWGSLQVDIEKTRNLLGWRPPVPFKVALQETARHFREDSH